MKNSPFQIILRNYCEWWSRPGLSCDRWGSAMDAAFKVSDYMAENFSENPMDYQPGVSGPGAIIEDSPELAEYLDTLTREQLRIVADTLSRYLDKLKNAKLDY